VGRDEAVGLLVEGGGGGEGREGMAGSFAVRGGEWRETQGRAIGPQNREAGSRQPRR
jgi:hypothetical protein